MARSIRRNAVSIVFPVATHPGRSGTEAPQSLPGSRLMHTRYCGVFITEPSRDDATTPASNAWPHPFRFEVVLIEPAALAPSQEHSRRRLQSLQPLALPVIASSA